MRQAAISFGTLAALASTAPLTAQTAPIAPPSRDQIERLPVAPVQRNSRLTVSDDVERAPCPLAEPRFAKVVVKIDKILFAHLEQVDPAELDEAVAPFLGHPTPIATICDIRDAAATVLRGKGYLAAVQIPPQRIEGGTVQLDVLMAHLIAVHVRGDPGHGQKRLGGFLERLKAPGPFNQHVAERALLLAGDLPGFDVHLTLRSAGTVPGEVVGDVTVTRIRFAIDAVAQNLGSRDVGPWSGLINVQANDLLGLGDRAVFGVYSTADPHEQNVVQGSYLFGLGSSGLTLAGHVTYAFTRPTAASANPIRARTLIATAEASYPLMRTQGATLRLAGGLDLVDQRLTFGGLPFTTDRLRVVYARFDYNLADSTSLSGDASLTPADPRWRANGALEVRQGMAGLGASQGCGPPPLYTGCAETPTLSRLDADPQATLIRYLGSVALKPTPHLTLVLNSRAQYAFAPVLSFEQYTLGNYTIGRGYDPGSLSGDSGIGTQFEVRVGPLPLVPSRGIVIEPFVFLDVARAWTRGQTASIYDRDTIASIGGGARVALASHALLEVLLAAPLGSPPLAKQPNGVRVLVNLATHFEPGKK